MRPAIAVMSVGGSRSSFLAFECIGANGWDERIAVVVGEGGLRVPLERVHLQIRADVLDIFMHWLWLVLNDVKVRLLRAEDIADILLDDQVLFPVDTLRNLFLLIYKLALKLFKLFRLAQIAVLLLFSSFMLGKV